MVAEAAGEIGDPQVRNRGTLGGSLAHADPAADYPAVMLALDAEIHVKGPNGWRKIRAHDFFQNLFTVDLGPNEIIAGVQFAPVRAAAYAKLHQRASHFAIVGVAAALDVEGGTIRSARVGLTGASTHARAADGGRAGAGRQAGDHRRRWRRLRQHAGADLEAVNADIHASEEYRRAMIPVFTQARAGTRRWRARPVSVRACLDCRQAKKRSCIIFDTPPIRRWPSLAMTPPVWTPPATDTSVPSPLGAQRNPHAALDEAGLALSFDRQRVGLERLLVA